jgi:3-hydroxymyristoyl/3-hydroxydecanoyl-(acyl carrier protein) dehydratase
MFEFIQSIKIDATAGTATARACVPADHPMLVDHFADQPLLPGSILVELGAQTAGPLVEEMAFLKSGVERWAFLGLVLNAKFLAPVDLPSELGIKVAVIKQHQSTFALRVETMVREVNVFRAELVMVLREAKVGWSKAIQERRLRTERWKERDPKNAVNL